MEKENKWMNIAPIWARNEKRENQGAPFPVGTGMRKIK